VPERGPVQRDEIVFLYKLARSGERDLFLRRIEVWDETQQRTLVFLTNHRRFAASTIAAIYRQLIALLLLNGFPAQVPSSGIAKVAYPCASETSRSN
jgi:hypothetical protein